MALRHYLPLATDSMGSRAALEEVANDPSGGPRRDIVQPIGSIYWDRVNSYFNYYYNYLSSMLLNIWI